MEKESDKGDKERQKEEQRKAALATFKTNLVDLAAAFYVESSNQYGEAGASAVDQYIYGPAVRKDPEIIYQSLLGSRQGKKRYTGNVSEWGIIQNAARIVQESLGALNVSDVLSLMGSKASIGEQYRSKEMAKLAESKSEEDKKLYEALVGMYQSHVMDVKVAEALGKRDKARVGQLEEMLGEPEAKKK